MTVLCRYRQRCPAFGIGSVRVEPSFQQFIERVTQPKVCCKMHSVHQSRRELTVTREVTRKNLNGLYACNYFCVVHEEVQNQRVFFHSTSSNVDAPVLSCVLKKRIQLQPCVILCVR